MPRTLPRELVAQRHFPDEAQTLVGRAEFLAPRERALIEAVFARGQSAAAIGRMLGVRERTAKARVRRLVARLTSREFLDAARSLRWLDESEATLAKLRYCQEMSLRQLARRYGLSIHAIRRRLDRLDAKIEGIRRVQRLEDARRRKVQRRDEAAERRRAPGPIV